MKIFSCLLIGGIVFFIFCVQVGCKYDKPIISVCDTTKVTYSGSIIPVLSGNCTGCHSGPNAPNGIAVDNYKAVKSLVNNGMLIGVINHDPGFDFMPKNSPKLDACSISKIRIWIKNGAQNN
ncbi:MAG: hypothetical protein M3004_14030 [Bacteroidota bacterium]|nr:hypothetical protein [Bacteroidota bacterium]